MENKSISEYRLLLEQRKGKRDQLAEQVKVAEDSLKKEKRILRNTEDAQLIIQTVAQQTQQQLEYHISDVVSTALFSIFDNPYEFKIEFVQKRGKTEADIYFLRDGEKIDPLTESGGGAVDVASFALRIALWNLAIPRSRNTIILDEPFRFLSRELQPRAGEALKNLSRKLKLQFIMVTHNDDLIEAADMVYEVKIKKGISHVEEL